MSRRCQYVSVVDNTYTITALVQSSAQGSNKQYRHCAADDVSEVHLRQVCCAVLSKSQTTEGESPAGRPLACSRPIITKHLVSAADLSVCVLLLLLHATSRHWATKLRHQAQVPNQRQCGQLSHAAGFHRPAGEGVSQRAKELSPVGGQAG